MLYHFFDVFPRIIPCNQITEIRLRTRFQSRDLLTGGPLMLQWIPADGILPDGSVPGWKGYGELPFQTEGEDTIVFRIPAGEEGEISCRLLRKNDASYEDVICEFSLYAAREDLLSLRPFRGDFHVHSNSSACGLPDDDPCFVTAMGRAKGLDFMTLNDHMQMAPSRQAAEFWSECKADLKIFPGEETHLLVKKAPTLYRKNSFINGCHIVNFGGNSGVNQYMNDHFDRYMKEVTDRAAAYDSSLPERVRFMMAGSGWLCDAIHERSGLAVFCHPYWCPNGRFDLPSKVREQMLAEGKFDALEVVGMVTDDNRSLFRESNMLGLARWQQLSIERGKNLPVLGSTDSHNAERYLGRQYTLVFSRDCSVPGIQEAIRAGRSVAVLAGGETSRQFFGDTRYVQFAGFLLREFYPEHDALCQAEGLAMLENLREEPASIPSGRIEKLMKHWWK